MILDTNGVSAFFEGVPAVCEAVGRAEVLAVPSIVLGEYRFGLAGSRLRAELEAQEMPFCYLDGSMPPRARQAEVDRFNQASEIPVFLISLKAGGTGLNLTAADTVVHFDPWWNPAVEAQAIDRAHRIGQTRHVFAYRLIAKDTVEEKVLQLQQTKRDLADAIISEDNALMTSLTAEDLQILLS